MILESNPFSPYRKRAIFLLPNHRPCGMMVPSGEAALLQGAQPCTAQQKSLDRGSLFAPLTPKGPLRRKADGIEKQPGNLPGLFAVPSGTAFLLHTSTREREEALLETRIAVIGIVVEEERSVEALNEILHHYRDYIIGRMGIPYRQKHLSVISIAVDAPQDVISALSGKVGRLPGVSSKTAYSGVRP